MRHETTGLKLRKASVHQTLWSLGNSWTGCVRIWRSLPSTHGWCSRKCQPRYRKKGKASRVARIFNLLPHTSNRQPKKRNHEVHGCCSFAPYCFGFGLCSCCAYSHCFLVGSSGVSVRIILSIVATGRSDIEWMDCEEIQAPSTDDPIFVWNCLHPESLCCITESIFIYHIYNKMNNEHDPLPWFRFPSEFFFDGNGALVGSSVKQRLELSCCPCTVQIQTHTHAHVFSNE